MLLDHMQEQVCTRNSLCIDLDKSGYQVNIFLISPQKHMLWVLDEALLMSIHNIRFHGEMRRISILFDRKSILPRPMVYA